MMRFRRRPIPAVMYEEHLRQLVSSLLLGRDVLRFIPPDAELVDRPSSGFKILISTNRLSGDVRTTVCVGSLLSSGSQRMYSRIDIWAGIL